LMTKFCLMQSTDQQKKIRIVLTEIILLIMCSMHQLQGWIGFDITG